MSRTGNHRSASTVAVDIVTLHRVVREWGCDDPEGKEKATNRLREAQAEQGVPLTPYFALYQPTITITSQL